MTPRSIPTCVGNTTTQSKARLGRTVHPHVCGEYQDKRDCIIIETGPSPRVWGIPRALLDKLDRSRSIPTCVGNTAVKRDKQNRIPVHPHVCGEYIHDGSPEVLDGGPSPRVWGIRSAATTCPRRYRSIPTCVGNTYSPRWSMSDCAVHPHVCGEYLCVLCVYSVCSGPSPRVWGIHLRELRRLVFSRSIPTCVGNTKCEYDVDGNTTVHPHVCGEYLLAMAKAQWHHGPSPRVWGILRSDVRDSTSWRSIPTCVGNTA